MRLALALPLRPALLAGGCLALLWAWQPSRALGQNVAAAQAEFFETKIRPVLAAQCYSCHGAAKQGGGLRVDWAEGLRKGGDAGPAVAPGRPDESLIVHAIEHSEPGMEMPRKAAKLPENIAHDFRRWIKEGAHDPRATLPTPEESSRVEWQAKLSERRNWWSLKPLTRPTVTVQAVVASRDAVDFFIRAKLETAGLAMSAPASRAVIARRLSFLLTGLPPSAEDLESFLLDTRPDAYERLVDRWMASPHFGERWARHWMDVVRYGDTYGYEWDIPAKGSWRYRDYLVRAFNEDIPFDQLIREQVAGDLLPHPRINVSEQINESLIGPMFFQLGEKRHGDSAMFDGIHQEMLHNKIDAFSKAFQGLTVGCARCHDHKLDAVSQRDYYALGGVFMSPRWVTRTLDTAERNAAVIAELRSLKSQIRTALYQAWKEAAACWPKEWGVGQGTKAPATAFAKALVSAGKTPAWENPLRPWVEIAKLANEKEVITQAWGKLKGDYAKETRERSVQNTRNFRVVADFKNPVPQDWSVEGVGFRDGPVGAGDFVVALEGTKVVSAVLPAGLFTHAISPRLNGAVRTPFLNRFKEPRLAIETCGGDFSAERVVVDNAFIAERQTYLARLYPAWSVFSFPDLAERRVFLELATKTSNPNFPPRVGLGGPCSEAQVAEPQSWFGITRAVVSNEAGTPKDELARFQSLFQGAAPQSEVELAERFAAWWRASIERFGRNQTTNEDVLLLNWLVDQALLPNQSGASVRLQALVSEYRDTEKRLLEPETVNGLADIDEGENYRLNYRGEYDKLGPAIPRGYLGVFGRDGSSAAFHDRGSGRLELAELTASPENPLSARVYVNRIWHWIFGTGLVASPDDFGKLGDPPSHPGLLDFLAERFIEQGWSTKTLIRQIVLSETFRQGSEASPHAREVDPHDRLLHHFPLRRLEAEEVRDAILSASGRLDARLFGTPINPHRVKEDDQKRLFSGPLDGNGRRSLYTKVTIMEPPRFLATFNQPPPKIPSGRRDVTSLPAQALALLNDPFVLEQSHFWGDRIAKNSYQSVVDRLNTMFIASLGRTMREDEARDWGKLLDEFSRERNGDPRAVWSDVAHTLFNTKEFLYLR